MISISEFVSACLLVLIAGPVLSDHAVECNDGPEPGPWGMLLEDWAVGHSDRQDRILKLPNTSGYYISNRVDSPQKPMDWSQELNSSPPGKIVNKPPQYGAYQKQKPGFMPSPSDPTASGHVGGPTNTRKEVSETDLYLLGAIEKLVFRVDFMEKRLKKAEELIYYIMAGNSKKTEPCTKNFTRVGANCYHLSGVLPGSRELNWKAASDACKSMGAALAEMETIEENQDVVTFIQANAPFRGKDFWTGGLNPGLLWIWSNSARPVAAGSKGENSGNATVPIRGNGRCLKLAYSPSLRTYSYLGHDCSVRHHFICETIDKSLSNEIQRISRQLDFE